MRFRAWVIVCLSIHSVFGQQDPDTAAYARYAQAYNAGDTALLMALAQKWSGRGSSWTKGLGGLSRAAHDYRANHIKTCLARLDTLEPALLGQGLLSLQLQRLRAAALKRSMAFEQAMSCVEKALAWPDLSRYPRERADLLIIRAELERKAGRYDRALQDLMVADRLADSAAYPFAKGNAMINRGNVYYEQDRLDEAWAAFSACLRYATAHSLVLVANNAAMNLGSTAHRTGRYQEAIHIYDSLITSPGLKDTGLRADLMMNAAFAHARMGRHQHAIALYQTVMRMDSAMEVGQPRAKLMQHFSGSLWALGRKNEAMAMLDSGLAMARAHRWPELESEILYKSQSWFGQVGRYREALERFEAYKELTDSLNEGRFGERIGRLEVQFETEKKEQTIKVQGLELEKTQSLQRASEVQRNIVIGVLGALLVLAFLGYRNMRQKQVLSEQQRQLSDHRVEQVLRDQELRVVNAVLEGQEKERSRIAKDLHDRVGSLLSAVKMQFGALEGRIEKVQATAGEQYRRVTDLLDTAVGEVRRISHDMEHGTLATFGLATALEDLREAVEVPGKLEVELNTFGLTERLDKRLEIAAYRMVQEAVSNALKHAKAGHLSIQVTRSERLLNIVVEDDGAGFDPARSSDGMGMSNLRSRAAEFNGTVHLDTRLGRGTTVLIDLPLAGETP